MIEKYAYTLSGKSAHSFLYCDLILNLFFTFSSSNHDRYFVSVGQTSILLLQPVFSSVIYF